MSFSGFASTASEPEGQQRKNEQMTRGDHDATNFGNPARAQPSFGGPALQ
jgi:hypothetical protein